MVTRYTYNNLVWVDLVAPTQDEAREIMGEFGVDPLVAEELLAPTIKPRVDEYSNYLYLILHFPTLRGVEHMTISQELDFLIGKDFLITVRYDNVDPLHEFSKVFEVKSIIDREHMGEHAGFIFFYMARTLYRAISDEMSFITESVRSIEDRMFGGQETEMVFRLSEASKDLINFKRTLATHKEVLSSFENASSDFFGEDFRRYAKAITGEFFSVQTETELQVDIVAELRETNNSLVSTRQNEVMKKLTIMAFVTFPLSLIAGIFGMNTVVLPVVGHPQDFWIILAGMGIAMALFFVYFKYNKWL